MNSMQVLIAMGLVGILGLPAQGRAQIVQGRKVSFQVPTDYRLTEEERKIINSSDSRALPAPYTLPPKLSAQVCPASTALLKRILRKIYVENNLDVAFADVVKPELSIYCVDVKDDLAIRKMEYDTEQDFQLGFSIDGLNRIIVVANALPYYKSEDEIAFLLSHELVHGILHHNALTIRLYQDLEARGADDFKARQELSKQKALHEAEADRLGALLAINAGYNPMAVGSSLRAYTQYNLRHLNWLKQKQWQFKLHYASDEHGTTKQREARVQNFLVKAGIEVVPFKPVTTAALERARIEMTYLKGTSQLHLTYSVNLPGTVESVSIAEKRP